MEEDSPKTIYFYRASDEFGYYSNFSRHRIYLKGKLWPSTEHFFQAQKFSGTIYEEHVRLASTPNKSASMGRDRSKPLRKDWETVKDGIMREALMAKFTQHKNLKQHLLASKGSILVEHTEKDSYWGDGYDGSGKNMLGKLLMSVRDELLGNPANIPIQSKEDQAIINKMEEEDNADEEDEEETEKEMIGSISATSNSAEDEEKEEEEEEEEEEKEKVNNGISNSDLKKIKKTRHDMTMKKATSGRKKARSKRGVFLDAQGESIIEKSNDGQKGNVDIVGKDGKEVVKFNSEVLPPNAKIVLHRHQFRRRGKPTEEDFDEDEEEVEDEFVDHRHHHHKVQMSDFLPAQGFNKHDDEEEYLFDPVQCIEASKNTIELLRSLPKEDPSVIDLLQKCKQLKDVIQGFIEGDIPADMDQLLKQFENLSTIISEYELKK